MKSPAIARTLILAAFWPPLSVVVAQVCPVEGRVVWETDEYPLASIGGQCWFAENLRTTIFANGDRIGEGQDQQAWAELTAEWPLMAQPVRKDVLVGEGMLYNGAAVRDPRGLCPAGWRVPSDEDWLELERSLGLSVAEAGQTGFRGQHAHQLRVTDERYEGWEGWDTFGFRALPGGFRDGEARDWNYSDSGFWWSTSEWKGGGELWMRSISNHGTGVYRSIHPFEDGLSVRCLKD